MLWVRSVPVVSVPTSGVRVSGRRAMGSTSGRMRHVAQEELRHNRGERELAAVQGGRHLRAGDFVHTGEFPHLRAKESGSGWSITGPLVHGVVSATFLWEAHRNAVLVSERGVASFSNS